MKETFSTHSGNQIELDVKDRFITQFNGSTIIIGESDGRNLVVKFSAYPWGAQREWRGLRKVFAAGIPSPTPVAFIPGEKPGIITEYIPGKGLQDDPDISLRYNLGILIRNMHERVSTEGTEWHGKDDFTYYDQKIAQWGKDHIGGVAIDIMQELAIDIGNSFKLVEPAFTHHDLYDHQAIINEDGLYLLDFEFWRESHPLDDLSSYLMNTIRTESYTDYFWEFCRGYGSERNFTEEQKKIIAFLLLFTSCQSLEFYKNDRPRDLQKPTNDHEKAISFVKEESLWKRL